MVRQIHTGVQKMTPVTYTQEIQIRTIFHISMARCVQNLKKISQRKNQTVSSSKTTNDHRQTPNQQKAFHGTLASKMLLIA